MSRYGRLEVSGPTGAQAVMLNGRPVLRGADVDADALSQVAGFRQGPHDLMVMKVEGGSACPIQYVVLDIVSADAAHATSPFGTCALLRGARLEGDRLVMDVSGWPGNGGVAVPAKRYIYANGGVKGTASEPPSAPAPDDAEEGPPDQRPSLKWIGPKGCRTYGGPADPDPASRIRADALTKDFEATYPKALADPARVDAVDLTPERLERITRCLAALSTWPGTDGFLPDQAAALFASSRYGSQAFAALDRLAAAPGEDGTLRSAARSFSAQMKGHDHR